MPSDGRREVLARWRESGEWWSAAPYLEFERFIDADGIRRETEREVPLSDGSGASDSSEQTENAGRFVPRKFRDEKVARACGLLPGSQVKQFHVVRPDTKRTYAALHTISGYACGRGAMHAEEIPIIAAQKGLRAVALADPFSLAGVVEFARSAKSAGIKPLIGATVEIENGGEIVLIARSRRGYSDLSQLISACHLQEPRLFPLCTWQRMERWCSDLICLTGGHRGPLNRLLAGRHTGQASELIDKLKAIYGSSNVYAEIERSFMPWEISVNSQLLDLAEAHGIEAVAGGLITHETPERFPAQDVLVCIETLCTVDEIVGRKPQRHPEQDQIKPVPERAMNHERYLRSADEFCDLFADRNDLIENTLKVAERCDDDVLPPRTVLPILYDNSEQTLRDIVYAGAHLRYPTVDKRLARRIQYELDRIVKLNFTTHFLVAYEMCHWADEQGILFSGRGSAVDSVVLP